ncbi:MAG: MoaD/ThiS family protein [Promethearchaeota archaeon]
MCARVSIQLLNIFRLELKVQYLSYEGELVSDVISFFESEYLEKLPKYLKSNNDKHLNKEILILLNGENIRNLNGQRTVLHDGDEIQLSVPIIGG